MLPKTQIYRLFVESLETVKGPREDLYPVLGVLCDRDYPCDSLHLINRVVEVLLHDRLVEWTVSGLALVPETLISALYFRSLTIDSARD